MKLIQANYTMSLLKFSFNSGFGKLINLCAARFSTSSNVSASTYLQWRKENRLEQSATKYGPLTNNPDYSFTDGRVAPIGTNHFRRLDRHRKYAERIVRLTKEIDDGKELYQKKCIAEAEKKNRIISSKLKQKGHSQLR